MLRTICLKQPENVHADKFNDLTLIAEDEVEPFWKDGGTIKTRHVNLHGFGPTPTEPNLSVSILWVAIWLILGVDIHFHHTSSGTGMVRSGLPRTFHEFRPFQLLEYDTAPVFWRTYRRQAGLALPTVLITEDARLPQAIAA